MRRVVPGVLRQAGEERRLPDRDVARARSEELSRRRFDTVCARAKVDLVQIHFEDLVLRVRALDLEREQRFLHLARDGYLEHGEEVSRELLRDRARALDDAAGLDVG